MKANELYKNMKKNSIGSDKKTNNKFERKRVFLKTTLSTILSLVLVFSSVGCSVFASDDTKAWNEFNQIYDDYGYTSYELRKYELERLDKLLEDNGLDDYTRDEDNLRDYDYTVDDYRRVEDFDETYLHAFYSVSNDKSVDVFAESLGYDDLHDYLNQNNYLTSVDKVDDINWSRDNTIDMAKIKSEEENSKGRSL